MLMKIHQTCGIIQVSDGNMDVPLIQHIAEPVKQRCLLLSPTQIGSICSGEMAEDAFCMEAGKLRNFCTEIGIAFGNLKADPTHAGIHGNVEMGGQANGLGRF